MNKQSLSHIYARNQDNSSWIDDPFGLNDAIGAFKGLPNMDHNRNLANFAEELVAQYAKFDGENYNLCLEELPECEQKELARLYIESIDREIEWACYGPDESINSDFLCALLSMLKDDCKETRQNFAEVTRKNILTYYQKPLEEILNTACSSYFCSMMNENGYYQSYDENNGDVVWRR